jgi:hypothetical protein
MHTAAGQPMGHCSSRGVVAVPRPQAAGSACYCEPGAGGRGSVGGGGAVSSAKRREPLGHQEQPRGGERPEAQGEGQRQARTTEGTVQAVSA